MWDEISGMYNAAPCEGSYVRRAADAEFRFGEAAGSAPRATTPTIPKFASASGKVHRAGQEDGIFKGWAREGNEWEQR